jgi:glycerophosphoryl diester phosphodiesterase
LIHLLEDKVPGDDELRAIKQYADGIGLNSRIVIPANPDRTLQPPTDLVAGAHAMGLLVHIWTPRSEPMFLSPTYNGKPEAEDQQFRDLGVDGIFTDFADFATRALHADIAPQPHR